MLLDWFRASPQPAGRTGLHSNQPRRLKGRICHGEFVQIEGALCDSQLKVPREIGTRRTRLGFLGLSELCGFSGPCGGRGQFNQRTSIPDWRKTGRFKLPPPLNSGSGDAGIVVQ